MIQIRKIKSEDEAKIQDLLSLSGMSADTIRKNFKDFAVFSEGDKLLGFGCGIIYDGDCLINWIFINEAHRRKGYGSLIVKFLLNMADINGIDRAFLNTNCIEFARSLKFLPIMEEYCQETTDKYSILFGEDSINKLYEVDLCGYFKSCGCKP